MCRKIAVLSAVLASLFFVGLGSRPTGASEPNLARIIPPGSLAAVHVRVPELVASKNFDFLKQLAARVAPEASQFSQTALGVDVATLSELTVVIPPQGTSPLPPGDSEFNPLIAATFIDAIRVEELTARLVNEFGFAAAADRVYSNREDLALQFVSNHTVIVGRPSALARWMDALAADENSGDDASLTQALKAAVYRGHVVAAWNIGATRSLAPTDLPPGVDAFLKADTALAALRFDDKLGIHASLRFQNQEDARAVAAELSRLKSQGEALLTMGEAAATHQLQRRELPLEEGASLLAGLPAVRQGQAYLGDVAIEQEGAMVHATGQVDNEITSAVMVCLTAIRAIGEQANHQFSSVADQLQ